MKRDPKEIVEFGFMVKTYYREVRDGYATEHEVKGSKTLKLFKSWFKLMKNRKRLLYGVVKFADGETWIWQPPSDVRHDKYWHGGWQKALSATAAVLRSQERKCDGNEWGI